MITTATASRLPRDETAPHQTGCGANPRPSSFCGACAEIGRQAPLFYFAANFTQGAWHACLTATLVNLASFASSASRIGTTKTTTEQEYSISNNKNQDCQTRVGRMSQTIISQLSNHETHDDRYFTEKLDELVESISRWARLFSRGQPPMTLEDMKNIRITPRVRDYISPAFLDIRSLMNAKNVGGKVRTRFVEVIMLRVLMDDRLWKRHVGFLERDFNSHKNLIQRMNCTGMSHCSSNSFIYNSC